MKMKKQIIEGNIKIQKYYSPRELSKIRQKACALQCRQEVEILRQRRKKMQTTKERMKEYIKEYRQRPEVKERQRNRMKEYNRRPEVKERIKKYNKEYRQRPEVKERQRNRMKEYIKEYRQRPEVKEHWKEYIKEYRLKRKLLRLSTPELELSKMN